MFDIDRLMNVMSEILSDVFGMQITMRASLHGEKMPVNCTEGAA